MSFAAPPFTAIGWRAAEPGRGLFSSRWSPARWRRRDLQFASGALVVGARRSRAGPNSPTAPPGDNNEEG